MPTKRTPKPKPRPAGGNKVPKINPPKPAPIGGYGEGYAGPIKHPMPRRWSPK
jgi:hypothetical protein